jgi:hypothetical protein
LTLPLGDIKGLSFTLIKWMKKYLIEPPLNLLADECEDIVLLQLLLLRIPVAPTTRPLPHPIITPSVTFVCVILNDNPKVQSPSASDPLNKSKSLHFPISEVILFSKFRTDYRSYESRCRLHDLFIASSIHSYHTIELFFIDVVELPTPRLLSHPSMLHSLAREPSHVNVIRREIMV